MQLSFARLDFSIRCFSFLFCLFRCVCMCVSHKRDSKLSSGFCVCLAKYCPRRTASVTISAIAVQVMTKNFLLKLHYNNFSKQQDFDIYFPSFINLGMRSSLLFQKSQREKKKSEQKRNKKLNHTKRQKQKQQKKMFVKRTTFGKILVKKV